MQLSELITAASTDGRVRSDLLLKLLDVAGLLLVTLLEFGDFALQFYVSFRGVEGLAGWDSAVIVEFPRGLCLNIHVADLFNLWET